MGKGIMGRRKSQFSSRSVAAVSCGKVKQGGKITAKLKLLPGVKPMFQDNSGIIIVADHMSYC